MNILLTGRWDAGEQAQWQSALAPPLAGHRLLTDAAQAPPESIEAAIVANPAPGALQGLPRLRGVQSLWAGVEGLLADTTLPPGLPLARMVDPAMATAMAETALWAVLALHRGYFRYQRRQAAGRWHAHAQRPAAECGVLLLGLGEMGRAVARALVAQGYPVTALARTPQYLPGVVCHAGLHQLPALLPQAQVLLNLLPLTPDTRGLLDAACLAALPPGAALVNLGRGAHLTEPALLAALDAGHLSHAVLDVFATEPLPAGHPFWAHPCITVLPHAAALTDPRSAAAVVAANIHRLARGEPMHHLVRRERGY